MGLSHPTCKQLYALLNICSLLDKSIRDIVLYKGME
jgi:hypothetical protein